MQVIKFLFKCLNNVVRFLLQLFDELKYKSIRSIPHNSFHIRFSLKLFRELECNQWSIKKLSQILSLSLSLSLCPFLSFFHLVLLLLSFSTSIPTSLVRQSLTYFHFFFLSICHILSFLRSPYLSHSFFTSPTMTNTIATTTVVDLHLTPL